MRILVIGDSCKDVFVYGKCDRICPEAPVPVFNPLEKKENGGMASNVYQNIKSLVGDEVEVCLITNTNVITKTRYVDYKTNQMLIRVDEQDKADPITHDLNSLGAFDAVVISDYDKGFLSEDNIKTLISKYPLTFIDTKKQIGDWIKGISFIKINEPEYKKNESFFNTIDYNYQAELIVTLGEKGVQYQGVNYQPKEVIDAFDLSGAGDTFLAGLVTSYLLDKDMPKAVQFAQECAGKVIARKGVAVI